MKRIFLLLIALSSFVLSEVVFSNIDECKIDVYFGNGILTDREAAKYNTFRVLKPAIIPRSHVARGNAYINYKLYDNMTYLYIPSNL